MKTSKVIYSNVEYTVYNPGELLLGDDGYLLDQLKEGVPRMGRYRRVYLKEKYNLTEEDYYLIVVCDGDRKNLPECQYEGCHERVKFNQLLPASKIPVLAKGCCDNHTRSVNFSLTKEKWGDKFLENLKNADYSYRNTEEYREMHRQYALKQVEEGTHPWLRKNSLEFRRKAIEEGKNTIVNMWKAKKELNNPEKEAIDIYDPAKMRDIDYVLFSERESFKNRENITDICEFYVAFLDDERFKIGVTKNLINRAEKNRYHGLKYKNPISLYKNTRDIIADLEYLVKKTFIKRVALGTETFHMKDYDEIMSFIKEQIKLLEDNNCC